MTRAKAHLSLAHPVPPPTGEYRWVYLWHWPIRAMHWIAAVSIVALVVTGFYIGRPYFMTSGAASGHYLMARMRFIHFIAAGALVATAILRAYWLLAGNQFERWPALFPVRRRDWVNLYRTVKYYLMIQPRRAPHYLGHNPLQQLSYTGIYITAALMVITGFILYAPATFDWAASLVGGIQIVRVIHHVLTWVFILFVPIHIYLASRSDIMERSGTITSIVSGGRFVSTSEHYVDE